jgi:adenine-specific DNA-methyltransferase
VVWHYRAGVACRTRFSPRNEKLLWLEKTAGASRSRFDLDAVRVPAQYPNQTALGRRRVNPLGKNPGDVWELPKVTSGAGRSSPERVAHPAQMPLALAQRVIVSCSRPLDLVLDPFGGSGTTAVAAVRAGRRTVHFELRTDFLAIAAERLQR